MREGQERRAGLIGELLAPEPWPHEGVAAWWVRAEPLALREPPAELAIALGARADRMAYVFAGGYLAALGALVPERDRGRTAALCATEKAGVHPRAIATTFADGRLEGEKTFVTLADHAQDLYVLAREGEAQGRALLALVRVRRDAPGVSLTPLPPMPFVPEIGHASVRFEAAPVEERLVGDGWVDYVLPFRTIEDVHVHLALVAHVVACASRFGWPRQVVERGLSILASLRAIAGSDPRSPRTHLALAGAIDLTTHLVDSLDWSLAPDADRDRWVRDRALLSVASTAREKRRERAWGKLSPEGGEG